MRRAHYQNGTVALKARSHGPAVWVYRWRECDPQGNSTRKSVVIGTTDEYTTKAQVLKAAEGHRLRANREGRETKEPTFGALIERFIVEEGLRDAKDQPRAIGVFEEDEKFDAEALDASTASSYLSMLKVHIRPRWENSSLSDVRPAMVQEWLRGLAGAPKTKGHIKALMHRLFEKAMLWELLPVGRNPMDLVHVKGISKRSKTPIILDPDQCLALISSLPDPYRTMVLVAICTGLRVSEILALRWSRIHFDRLTMMVKVKAVGGRIGRVKTECSEDELPSGPGLRGRARGLEDQMPTDRWRLGLSQPRHRPVLSRESDSAGLHPPAAEKLGVKGVGWRYVSPHLSCLA